jgi:uncharacterized protein (DUF849 family)
MEVEHYAETIDLIKKHNKQLIINLTTGPGGRFVPSEDDPKIFAPGTTLCHPLKRVEHIHKVKTRYLLFRLKYDELWSRRCNEYAIECKKNGEGDPRRWSHA